MTGYPAEFDEPTDPRFERILGGFTKGNERKKNSIRKVEAQFNLRVFPYISAAARERDISLTGFVTRSAIAVAAFDLGLDWNEVMDGNRSPQRFQSRPEYVPEYRHGQGAGAWQIEGMRSEPRRPQ